MNLGEALDPRDASLVFVTMTALGHDFTAAVRVKMTRWTRKSSSTN
jgi:hypothetical protein